jgi:hypothetical protein
MDGGSRLLYRLVAIICAKGTDELLNMTLEAKRIWFYVQTTLEDNNTTTVKFATKLKVNMMIYGP